MHKFMPLCCLDDFSKRICGTEWAANLYPYLSIIPICCTKDLSQDDFTALISRDQRAVSEYENGKWRGVVRR